MPSLLRTARTPRMVLTKLRVHDGLQIDLSFISSFRHRVELCCSGPSALPGGDDHNSALRVERLRLLTREPHVSIK